MNSLLSNSTLFVAIIAVGGLVYLGTVVFDPVHPTPRVIAGYLCGTALVLIGAGAFLFGAAYELPLLLQGVYLFETLHMEWLGLGVVALIVGALVIRQAFRRRL